MKKLVRVLLGLLLILAVIAAALRLRYGGGRMDFPDRTHAPALPETALEVVAQLPTPPGNIAVSAQGRVFLSLHPEAKPTTKIVELVNGQPQAYPDADTQAQFRDVLGIRLDAQHRLWTLDNGGHGIHPARLMAFDIEAGGKRVHDYSFPREIAPLGSHFNDLQVSADGKTIFIADASFFGKHPGIVVYDVATHAARRLLEGTPGVTPENYIPVVQGRTMLAFGLVAVRPGVDSIALSRDGAWLYFAPVTSQHLYRVPVADLLNAQLAPAQLAAKVETYAEKSMSDGITSDTEGNIYLTDPEHSAILRLGADRQLQTLLKSERLRWPDGFSFGPDGWLYFTCSSLQWVIGLPPSSVAAHAPYQVFRFHVGSATPAGQ